MSLFRLVLRSFFYELPMQVCVALGIAAASAVLLGALLVGDSLRGSLRDLTESRLGPITEVLRSDRFFRDELLAETLRAEENAGLEGTGLIFVSAGMRHGDFTAGATLVGCEDAFWNLFETKSFSCDPPSSWNRNEIVLNAPLAEMLGSVQIGDTISLWCSKVENIPAESVLGRTSETVFRKRLKVREILPPFPARGIGRFSLSADQKPQATAFVPLSWLQDRSQLNVPGQINMIAFTASKNGNENSPVLRPRPEDLGLIVDRREDATVRIKTSRMLFTKAQKRELQRLLPHAEEGLVYLVESLRSEQGETPYSLIAAVERLRLNSETVLQIAPGDIVLNRWTAEDLRLEIGDDVQLTWFEPESLHGVTKTRHRSFRVAGTVEMQQTGTASDSQLVPELQGITDADSLSNWNPPFPFDAKKIRDKDEDYWDEYRARPKGFIALETGHEIWSSRFGESGVFLLEDPDFEEEEFAGMLDPALFGLILEPVKRIGLESSRGTTPFEALFLGFSFFIIASALMLLSLLLRLSIERKETQIGILLATGWTRERVFRFFVLKSLPLVLLGIALGFPLGIAYAELMIYGLQHWWVDAIVVPFLTLHVSSRSLLLGFFGTIFLSLAVILYTLGSLREFSVLELLRGNRESRDFSDPAKIPGTGTGLSGKIVPGIFSAVFLLLLFFGLKSTDQMVRSGIFFASGAVVLVGGLYGFRTILKNLSSRSNPVATRESFAFCNAARNPGRSMLCVGLLSSSCFLVLAVGAFRLEGDDSTGTGGYVFVAETRLPVHYDPGSEEGRSQLAMGDKDSEFLTQRGIRVDSFRIRSGDNAGCLNLYAPRSPRVLGVGDAFIEKNRFFGPADSKMKNENSRENPWERLREPVHLDEHGIATVPIILDANTAMYSLHLYRGPGEIYELPDGRGSTIRCKVVGLLSNSLLQGDLVMWDRNLVQLFPEVSGFQFFLIEKNVSENRSESGSLRSVSPNPENVEIRRILGETFCDYGFSMEPARERLNRFFAVQNTYLSTFRSLGGFGVLLGTFGLGIVQLRNVLQRRREFALMQALGFRRRTLLGLLLRESVSLLLFGVLIGTTAAFTALFSQIFGPTVMSERSFLRQFLWIGGGMVLVGVLSNLAAFFAANRTNPARELAKE